MSPWDIPLDWFRAEPEPITQRAAADMIVYNIATQEQGECYVSTRHRTAERGSSYKDYTVKETYVSIVWSGGGRTEHTPAEVEERIAKGLWIRR